MPDDMNTPLAPPTQNVESGLLNRMFDWMTSDRFYKTLEQPQPTPQPSSEIEALRAEIEALKGMLAKPDPEPEPEPEPEPVAAEQAEPEPESQPIPVEPETAPLKVSGDELRGWLEQARYTRRGLGDYYKENEAAIAQQVKSLLEAN